MNDITILLTGAGAPGASGIIKSLRANEERDIRVIGVDMNSATEVYGFTFTDENYTVPPGGHPDYIPQMREIATIEDVDVILPLTTAELTPLSQHRDEFDARVMVSEPEALKIANNKSSLFAFLDENGFDSAPEFTLVDNESDFLDAVHSLGYPDQPVCFKPPVSSGGRGFRILDTDTDRLSRLLDQKPDTPVTTLDEVQPILSSAESFPELAVMEYLPGDEFSVDVLAQGETVDPVIPRSRTRTRAGITFEGTVENKPELIVEAQKITRALGLEYNINLQFKYDSDGNPRLIEINPRVAGTIILCVGAGVNMPYLGVKYAMGEPVPDVDVKWGTRMVRYWEEVFRRPDGELLHSPIEQPTKKRLEDVLFQQGPQSVNNES